MNFLKIASQTICLICTVIIISTLVFVSNVNADAPVLAFKYDSFKMNITQCVEVAEKTLVNNQLLTPEKLVNLEHTAFVAGSNEDITAIIDCSEVKRIDRVTVMVSHGDNVDTALSWAGRLLKSISEEYSSSNNFN